MRTFINQFNCIYSYSRGESI